MLQEARKPIFRRVEYAAAALEMQLRQQDIDHLRIFKARIVLGEVLLKYENLAPLRFGTGCDVRDLRRRCRDLMECAAIQLQA